MNYFINAHKQKGVELGTAAPSGRPETQTAESMVWPCVTTTRVSVNSKY